MTTHLPIAPTSLDGLADHPWDLVFCSPESADATRTVYLDSPYKARHDIKALDWETTRRSWDADVALWELEFDSIGIAAAHLETTGYDVAMTYDVGHAVVDAFVDRDFFAGWLRRDDTWVRIAPPFRPVVDHFGEADGSNLPRHILDLGILTNQVTTCDRYLALPAASLTSSTTELSLQYTTTNEFSTRTDKLLRTLGGDDVLIINEREHSADDVEMILRFLLVLDEELSAERKQTVGSYCERAGLTVATAATDSPTDSEAGESADHSEASEIHKIKRQLSYGSI